VLLGRRRSDFQMRLLCARRETKASDGAGPKWVDVQAVAVGEPKTSEKEEEEEEDGRELRHVVGKRTTNLPYASSSAKV